MRSSKPNSLSSRRDARVLTSLFAFRNLRTRVYCMSLKVSPVGVEVPVVFLTNVLCSRGGVGLESSCNRRPVIKKARRDGFAPGELLVKGPRNRDCEGEFVHLCP